MKTPQEKIYSTVTGLLFLIVLNYGTTQAQVSSQLAERKKLQASVEADPENLKSHKAYIRSIPSRDSTLEKQYEIWIKKFPKTYVVPFAIGDALAQKGDPDARKYLLMAASLKPDNAETWNRLWQDAILRGDDNLKREYIEKAKMADLGNPRYALSYATSFEHTDQAKFDSLTLAVTFRFPESEQGAQALYLLAEKSKNITEKSALYEQLYKRYSGKKSPWYSIGMARYFNLLLIAHPEKAFELALSMSLEPGENHLQASTFLKTARVMRDARYMLSSNKPSEALEIINITPPQFRYKEPFVLIKASAMHAAGQTQAAYDSLSVFYSRAPSDEIRVALTTYGGKLGKDEIQVDREIRKILDAKALQATGFTLTQYGTNERISLDHFKGKVTLITYWFPACGPCRLEFPHFESVLKKFNKTDVAYLGINIETNQDEYVLPFIASTGYSFIPLREEPREKGNLKEDGAPTNFLIDQEGRIIYRDFRITVDNERMLELMIGNLLKKRQ